MKNKTIFLGFGESFTNMKPPWVAQNQKGKKNKSQPCLQLKVSCQQVCRRHFYNGGLL